MTHGILERTQETRTGSLMVYRTAAGETVTLPLTRVSTPVTVGYCGVCREVKTQDGLIGRMVCEDCGTYWDAEVGA